MNYSVVVLMQKVANPCWCIEGDITGEIGTPTSGFIHYSVAGFCKFHIGIVRSRREDQS